MDKHRVDRYGSGNYNQDSYHNRRPSRFSDGPPSRFSDSPVDRYSNNGTNAGDSYDRRSPSNFRVGGHRPFESPPRRSPGGGGIRSMAGSGGGVSGGFLPMGVGGGGFESNYQAPPLPPPQPLSGQKRGFPFGGRGNSPDRFDGGSFAKLFVGSVPRTATEDDIRPLFERHGNVIEVALIKDKRTGQQQGCCFIKYATSEEADRAIKALHNQHTLPGGVGPIQVRYADGERERLGAVEFKLFVGSLNKQATEKEVEEIFSPYGRVEDVYLMRDEMKQSRGCGFVKYSHRDMAMAAINALNGAYTMRGCNQPLTVRFADPKRPRPGDPRGGPAFGGPGFGPRFQAPGPRPPPNFGDPLVDRIPPNAWDPMSPQNMGPSSNAGVRGFGSQLLPRSGELAMHLNQGAPLGGSLDGTPSGLVSSSAPQSFPHASQQVPPVSQQISPLQKPLQSPQHVPPSLQLHGQVTSYSLTQTSHVGQLQTPITASQTPFTQPLSSQHLLSLGSQLSGSQPQLHQGASSNTALQTPLNMNLQSHSAPAATNQQQLSVPAQQQLLQPIQQSPSQLAQMLSQQTQTLQASFQSSQQAFSQLQQQFQMMQPSNQSLPLQQSSQVTKQQLQWPGIAPQTAASSATSLPADVPPSTLAPAAAAITQVVAPVKCNWTEHTSPEGHKYYYNSVTRESRWEKPEEFILFEQQQLQQKISSQQPQTQSNPQVLSGQQAPQVQHPQTQTNPQVLSGQQAPQVQHPQTHTNPQLLPTLQVPQAQQVQLQAQFRHNQQLQQPSFSSEHGYTQLPITAGSANDPTRFQGLQAAQEWMWETKPAGN